MRTGEQGRMSPGIAQRSSRLAERAAEAYGIVLLLTVITFTMIAWLPSDPWARAASVALVGVTAVVGLASSRVSRLRLRLAAATMVVASVCAGIAAADDSRWLAFAAVTAAAIVLLMTQGTILRRVAASASVSGRTILGAITAYMMLGILFSYVYLATALFQNEPFFIGGQANAHGDLLFFSYTTLTTTGYGNLIPAGEPGESFAVIEMLTGQIFLVTLVAGLVSLWRPALRNAEKQETAS